MRKVLGVIFFITIFAASFSERADFTFIVTGNMNGAYKNLPNITGFITTQKQKDSEVTLINTGNNLVEEGMINDIYTSFFTKNKFDFNFLGNKEYKVKADMKKEIDYSAINIPRVNDKNRFVIVSKKGYNFAFIGINDLYKDEKEKSYDYEQEIKKLIYKIDPKVDFIFVVSELKRNENLELLKKFPAIAVIFETGNKRLDKSYIKSGYSYIVPQDRLEIITLAYNREGAQILNSYNPEYKIKNLFITGAEYITDMSYFDPDEGMAKEIKWQEAKIKKIEEEILGYNDDNFYKEDMYVGENLSLITEITKRIKQFYGADIVVLPAKSVIGNLMQGFYNIKDLDALFSNDKIVVMEMDSGNYKELYKSSQGNRGNSSFLNFFEPEKVDIKNKYRVVSTENIFEDYRNIKVNSKEIKTKLLKDFAVGVSK